MLDKKNKMFIQIDWQKEIKVIAGIYQGNRKNWLAQAANKAGISFQKAESLFYRRCRDPKTSIALCVLSAAEKARDEAGALATQFETAAGILNANGKNENRDDVLTLLRAASALRGVDTASNHGGSFKVKGYDDAVVSPVVQMVESSSHDVAEVPAEQGEVA